MTNTAEYDIAVEVGNTRSKGKTDGAQTIIENLVMPYDGSEDQLAQLGVLNMVDEDLVPPPTLPDQDKTDSIRYFFENRQLIAGIIGRQLSIRTYSKISYARFGSQEWKDLIAATFAKLRKRSGAVRLSFAIPVALFKDQQKDEHGRTKLEAIRHLLLNTDWSICVGDSWREFTIIPEDLQIVPEGLGILWYLLLSADGLMIADRELAQKKFKVVIDWGSYNTSILTFAGTNRGPYNESLTTGLLDIRAEVNRKLKSRYGRTDVDDDVLDAVIRTGMYSHAGGDPEPVQDIVNNATAPLINQVLNLWNRDLGGGADVGAVVSGGGGSIPMTPLIKPQIAHRNFIQIPVKDAAMAGALGLWRLRKFQREYAKTSA